MCGTKQVRRKRERMRERECIDLEMKEKREKLNAPCSRLI